MDYALLAQDNDFHEWGKLEPLDTDYVKYGENNPAIIAAAHKIVDVYSAFANARQAFMSVGYNNYGDLCSDSEVSKIYIKTHFLLHAVIEYAICLDLSWQVIWAYIQLASFEYLLRNEYKSMERECDRDNLLSQLDCAIAQKSLKAERVKNIMLDFDNDDDVMKLRSLYNYIKHRGTIHFNELGTNDNTMMARVDGKNILKLNREEYTIEKVENTLFTYHKKFQTYFNELIAEIIPSNYENKNVPVVDYVNTILKMNSIQNMDN